MAKIFNYYKNDVDHTWYDSSNLLYTEMIDRDNALKTLKVTFKNGKEYQYDNVNINDYLLIRESESTGKEFNKIIKEKQLVGTLVGEIDPQLLKEEYAFRSGNGYSLKKSDSNLIITDSKDKEIFNEDISKLDKIDLVKKVMESLNMIVKIEK